MASSIPPHLAGHARGSVVLGVGRDAAHSAHEAAAHQAIAQQLAELLGYEFAGAWVPGRPYPGPLYFVPGDVLIGLDAARSCGIRGAGDLFGGVVPDRVTASKAITHPLVDSPTRVPDGWSDSFAERVRPVVLPGYSAFAAADARRAGRALLHSGPVRIKPAQGNAGRGQRVAADISALDATVAGFDEDALALDGIVLETDLLDLTTWSVGQVRVGYHTIAYYGTQWLTRDNGGDVAYGGSSLRVHRGGFDALLREPLPPPVREAAAQAQLYDEAARQCFPRMFASRRNYDVVQGKDHAGRPHAGVLESSWRIGGASGAEATALLRFRDEPGRRWLSLRTEERYGADATVPAGATVLFHGVDPGCGPLLKYTLVEDDDHT
ncbi:DUF3182 family protein [Frateuria terrea]|uniref:Biotin carboxylase n=1 Tax=Frateuria terrea TaxID=529704 RepID=A0A1H6VCS1_9GAMM|nr:DUF3182 family protein [Frateuria terrea]SEJ02439.1 Protein of unknown function [Frateuria terrea]SFP64486.1 Protein of unknown function [Frateuria terrea]